jgi:hypothetical protein
MATVSKDTIDSTVKFHFCLSDDDLEGLNVDQLQEMLDRQIESCVKMLCNELGIDAATKEK